MSKKNHLTRSGLRRNRSRVGRVRRRWQRRKGHRPATAHISPGAITLHAEAISTVLADQRSAEEHLLSTGLTGAQQRLVGRMRQQRLILRAVLALPELPEPTKAVRIPILGTVDSKTGKVTFSAQGRTRFWGSDPQSNKL